MRDFSGEIAGGTPMPPIQASFVAWGLFTLSWIAAAFWADRAQRRAALREELLYRLLTFAGAFLLFRPAFPHAGAGHPLWSLGPAPQWALFVLVLIGLAFTWWARLHLGRLWSASITKKAQHHIVDSGPYGIVRHPIYTGILAAALATAAEMGTAEAVAGLLVLFLAFWIKARLEERFLSEQLGAAPYEAYRQRVPMLIPFG
jgi:protein-S-isoprenylcysteine O-methyltransferase Ste14